MPNSKCLNIITWNARAIRHKKDEFFNFLIQNNIGISLVCETWLKLSDKFYHPNYIVYRNDRSNQKGGGVALIVSRHITQKQLPIVSSHVIENVGIQISLNNGIILSLYGIYFPGNTAKCLNMFCGKVDKKHTQQMFKAD